MLDRGKTPAVLLSLALVPALTACPDRNVAYLPLDATGQTSGHFTLAANSNLDLLFVVDDSGSMKREQDQMAAHFRKMIDILDQLPGGRPNLHVGVVSTDIGADQGCSGPRVPGGQLRNEPNPSNRADLKGCSGPRDRYLSDVLDEVSGDRVINYPPPLSDAFACIATLGISGCRFEAPLEAMRRALDPANPANAGFLRPDSLLAIVFLTDEDDCSASDPRLFGADTVVDGHDIGRQDGFRCFSEGVVCDGHGASDIGPRDHCQPTEDSVFMEPIDEYVDAVKRVRPNLDQVVVAGIMGAPDVAVQRDADGNPEVAPSCALPGGGTDDTDTAFPPVRTDAFLAKFRSRVRTQICADDLSPAIEEIGKFIAGIAYGRCLRGELYDMDAATPGIQPECSVQETVAPLSAEPLRSELPACKPGQPAPLRGCWRLEEEAAVCDTPTHLRVAVDYPADVTRAPDTTIDVRCRSR